MNAATEHSGILTISNVFGALLAGMIAILMATPYYYLAVLPGLLIILLMLTFRAPQIAFYMIVFLIPYAAYRQLSGPLSFLKFHWLLAMLLVVVLFIIYAPQKKIPESLRSNLWPWLLMFLVVNLISAIFSDYVATAFDDLSLWVISYIFIAVGMVVVNEKSWRLSLPKVLIISITISSLMAVVGYVFDISWFLNIYKAGELKRGYGGAVDANNFSLMIIFNLPFMVHYFLYSRRWWIKGLVTLLAAINLAALVTTYSRGGALVFLFICMCLFLEHIRLWKPKNIGFFLTGIALVIITIAIAVPQTYWERQKTLVGRTDYSLNRRFSYLVLGYETFKQHPLLGSGPGVFRDIYLESDLTRFWTKERGSRRRHAHNSYMEILVGSGLVGLGLFGGTLVIAWRNFSQARRKALQADDSETASLWGTYRVAFLTVMVYLFVLSETHHKYLLLSLIMSQVAWSYWRNNQSAVPPNGAT